MAVNASFTSVTTAADQGFDDISPFDNTGYPQQLLLDPKKRNQKQFQCCRRQCKNILKEPMQTECGHHYCKKCIDILGNELSDGTMVCWGCVEENRTEISLATGQTLLDQHEEINLTNDERSAATVSLTTVHPAYAIAKVLNKLLVCCPWSVDCVYSSGISGSSTRLQLKDLDDHVKVCQHRMVVCTKCKDRVRLTEFPLHSASECKYRIVSCPYQCGEAGITFTELENHQAVCQNKPLLCQLCNQPVADARHLIRDCRAPCPLPGCSSNTEVVNIGQHFSRNIETHMELFKDALLSLREPANVLADADYAADFEAVKSDKNSLMARILMISTRISGIHQQLEEALSPQLTELQMSLGDLLEKTRQAHAERQRLDVLEKVLQTLENDRRILSEMGSEFSALERTVTSQESDLADRLRELEEQISLQEVQYQQAWENTQWLLFTSFKGHLVWRIENCQQLISEAKSNPSKRYIDSPIFFLGKYSYKMRARLYLVGDGSGKGTHISLYFMLLRGEYDAVLNWPFKHTVTFILKSQIPDQVDIIERFKPDVTSSSFARPTTDANIASGSPQFARQANVFNETFGYIRDDVMFIEVIVDPSTYERGPP